ncbi:hypothetical protein QWZ10_19030 [Paracoccus cavernae]|uniref:Uncharacterized protein n=1 Tax=Paracoccus cavernae TaxID=1571207 RepID=A0ABT8DDC6_9RHOB|nr:hypothetical protein [Paracoccus cavernae]
MKQFCFRSIAAAVAFSFFAHLPATAQETDWQDVLRQVRNKQAAEDAARDASREKLRREIEAIQKEREKQSEIIPPSRLREWMRDPSPPPTPGRYWVPVAMLAASGAMVWAIWRGRGRIGGAAEEAIVLFGVRIVRIFRAIRAGVSKIRKRIIDRAG